MTSTLEPNATSPPLPAPAGAGYWRSIRDHAATQDGQAAVNQEFPGYDPDDLLAMPRRQFMQFAAASMALAGLTLTGCRRWPKENLAPYADRPEGTMPGVPERYATSLPRDGVSYAVTVLGVDGRPIKIEGNAQHPWARGKTDPFLQAQTLELYDPQRLRRPTYPKVTDAKKRFSTWGTFDREIVDKHFSSLEGANSSKFAVLAEPMAGPTVDAVKAELKKKYPDMAWYTWSPLHRDAEVEGARQAFSKQSRAGQTLRPIYDLAAAKVIVCFDADLLGAHPAASQHAAGWAKGRAPADASEGMNRLYVVEPAFSLTGSNADIRHALPANQIPQLVMALAQAVGVAGEGIAIDSLDEPHRAFVKTLLKDLGSHREASVVVAGPNQPAEVHAACHAINAALGNLGRTVTFTAEPDATAQPLGPQIEELARRLNNGHIDTLLILGGNPAFDAPADLGFADLLRKPGTVIRLGLYEDETARLADWALPMAHPLTAWGDGLSWDGTIDLQQPLIHPLFNGRSAIEVLARLAKSELPVAGYDLVRAVHRAKGLPGGQGFEKNWRSALHQGFVAQSTPQAVFPSPEVKLAGPGLPLTLGQDVFELSFRPGALHDGRYANNGWLQELPDTLTKATWGNPLLIAASDAKRLGLDYGDIVRLTANNVTVESPVYLMPGQARGTLVAALGHGRTAAGPIGGYVPIGEDPADHTDTLVGTDFYPLRSRAANAFVPVRVEKTGGNVELCVTTEHHKVFTDFIADWAEKKRAGGQYDSGKIVKEATLDEFRRDAKFAQGGTHGDVKLQLFDPPLKAVWEERAAELRAEHPEAVEEGWTPPDAFNSPHAWGMTIDLSKCTGCSACVVACQAENNIPVVGPRGVQMSREMHWLRIDTYYKPTYKDPKSISPEPDWDNPNVTATHMPLACVHCENAPCEQVCPVAATVHDTEGLNTMVYNRCIGTRYCSNNCPYKVRRFNYFEWHSKPAHAGWAKPWLDFPDTQLGHKVDAVERMKFNPEVTVRMRGVMEKCTFCSQRIKAATIAAKNQWSQSELGRPGVSRESFMVQDGEVVTACEEACPTQAIVFGNLNDPEARVSKIQSNNPRAYSVLSELNTRPRTQHLAKLRNVPGLAPKDKAH